MAHEQEPKDVSDEVSRRWAQEDLERVRGQLAEVEGPWLRPAIVKRLSVVFLAVSLGLSGIWTCFMTGIVEGDPLFGAHADMLCPRVCAGCTGPYRHASWITNHDRYAGNGAVYCDDARGQPREIPGGVFTIMVTMGLAISPFALAVVAVLAFVDRRNYLRRRSTRQQALEEVEARIAATR